MIFQELVLENIGVFLGRHVVNLSASTPERPLILFGGLNGGGKTTILEALQLALYGPRFNGARRGNQAYSSYLEGLINKHAEPNERAVLELEFLENQDGHEVTYRVCRMWSQAGKKTKEQVEVYTNGQLDQQATEEWDELVETFLPRKLCNLFFFDGEQIEKLAESEKSHEILSAAITSLLGLELVDQLQTDMRAMKTTRLSNTAPEETQAELSALVNDIADKSDQLDELHNSRSQIALNLGRVRNEYERATVLFQRQGGDLVDRSAELEAKKARTDAEIEGLRGILCSKAAGPLPLSIISDQLQRLVNLSEEESRQKAQATALPFVKEREQEILEWIGEQEDSATLAEALREFLGRRDSQANSSSSDSVSLSLTDTGLAQLRNLETSTLADHKNESKQTLDALAGGLEKLEAIERELAKVPDKEGLVEIITRREQARHDMTRIEAELSDIDGSIAKVEKEWQALEKQRLQMEESIQSRSLKNELEERFVKTTDVITETLSKFKSLVLVRHLGRLEEFILDCYQQLLRKTGLVSRIKICPDSLELSVFDFKNERIDPAQLSAGERQLLATATLWGLARSSGRTLPVVIDTPLGRLDGQHRDRLVEHYFPKASPQVLILSTDEEVTGAYYEKLSNSLASEYEIFFDDQAGSSCVRTGYPFSRRAA